jgi:hypothetical protein
MKTRTASAAFAIGGALILLGGCASEPESHLVTNPPPTAPTSAPMADSPQAPQVLVPAQQVVPGGAVVPSYVIAQAPPPEAVPPRPSSAHLWVPGHWTWQNSRYAWMAGHWEEPPTAGAAWVPPRWEPEGGAIRFYEGHWE